VNREHNPHRDYERLERIKAGWFSGELPLFEVMKQLHSYREDNPLDEEPVHMYSLRSLELKTIIEKALERQGREGGSDAR
jgi:hypothetical protein